MAEIHSTAQPDKDMKKEEGSAATTVSDLSPDYPRYRDPLIKGVAIAALLILLLGGYYIVKTGSTPFSFQEMRELWQDPAGYFSGLVGGKGAREVCETFIKEHPAHFSHLGQEIRLTLVSEDIRASNRVRMARITLNATGNRGVEMIHFYLEKGNRGWRVISVASQDSMGEYRILHPQTKKAPKRF